MPRRVAHGGHEIAAKLLPRSCACRSRPRPRPPGRRGGCASAVRSRVVLHAVDREPRPRDAGRMPSTTPTDRPSSRGTAPARCGARGSAEGAGHARLGAEVTRYARARRRAGMPSCLAHCRASFERDLPGHHAAGDHRGLKAAPSSLVKIASVTGWRRADPVRVERADRLEPQSTPSWPSYLPPVGTRVHVRAHHDRGQRLAARPARRRCLPIWSTLHAQARPRASSRTMRSRPRLSLVGQRQPGEPPARRLADPARSSSMACARRVRSMPSGYAPWGLIL